MNGADRFRQWKEITICAVSGCLPTALTHREARTIANDNAIPERSEKIAA